MLCANKTCSATVVGPTPTDLAKERRSRKYSLTYWISFVSRCLERRRQRQALLQLDDRMLADIGLSRSQAFEEANKPFWK
jgi:uncharacterized protein YjiS (DUF1127 family)